MESISERELAQVARLVEITSDAVALCSLDGDIKHVNEQFLALMNEGRSRVAGTDIKDLVFSERFERAEGHKLPFTLDGSDNTNMLKLADGSFIPVRVRAMEIVPRSLLGGTRRRNQRVLVAVRSLEEQYAHDRQTQRLLSQLRSANKRLQGTLSIIMSTVGADNMPKLLGEVLNRLVNTLDADGSTIYFAESGGFKLRGTSRSLIEGHAYVPDFVPFGAGTSTYVLRAGHACRFSIVPPDGRGCSCTFYDLDTRVSTSLRLADTPPFKTMLAAPVFFGTKVLGILELGWHRPTKPRPSDLRVLEVICDYLSIELVGLVSNLRAQRTAELTRALNRLRDAMFSAEGDRAVVWRQMEEEVGRTLACHVCPVVRDRRHEVYVVDFEGGSRVVLPGGIEETFFSTVAPASRAGAVLRDTVPGPADLVGESHPLAHVRLTRVDRISRTGHWLEDHGLPCQGVFMDLGPDALDTENEEPAGEAAPAALAVRSRGVPHRFLLFLRDASQEPIDDMEYDFLERLAHDYELMDSGERGRESDRRIAQALQVGMRNDLGRVPGIRSDALYSSATKQALVGGDFYTLIRLPDERAVMILGDVSGKGVEAASMSAMAKTALSAYAWEGMSPVSMVRALNRMLSSFSRVETFVTVFVAKIDLRAKIATYCSAGHPPTMLVRPGREVELLTIQSGVVGAFDTMRYEGGSFTFQTGDILFMYTDGAIEARDAAGAFFGEQRLRDLVLQASAHGVDGLCETVLDALDTFTESALDDDVALVALELDEPEASSGPSASPAMGD